MRAASVEELARDPVGRFVAGATWAHFCAAPAFWGVLLWGRPTEEHAVALGRSLVAELGPPAEPHASIIDASRVEGVDAGAFGAAGRYLARHRAALRAQVRKVALVRPGGIGGAIVAGAYQVLPRPYPVEVFEAARDALAWLGEGTDLGGSPADRAGALDDVFATASGTPALVASLRAHLEAALERATLGAAASALGLSERSLQRKLASAGTSFQDELGLARVRVAQRLLMDEGASITAVALEVGCASLQHFGVLFRRATGESPSAWRRKARAELDGPR
jgi:AraC-like DNA-binding protein